MATVINKGTTPVILTVTASAKNATGSALKFVSGSAVASGTAANVAMSIVPAKAGTVSNSSLTADAVTNKALTATGQSIVTTGVAAQVVTDDAVDFGTDAKATATFFVNGTTANFDIKQTTVTTDEAISGHVYKYEAADGAVWDTVGFAISGKCNTNPDADWNDVTVTANVITVDVVYTLTKMTDTQKTELYGADGDMTQTDADNTQTATVDATTKVIGGTFTVASIDGGNSSTEPQVTKLTGVSITNNGGDKVQNAAGVASRWAASNTNVFVVSASDVATIENLSVTKIVVDGTEYDASKITAKTNTYTVANSDGKCYSLTGFSGSSVAKVEVYYGTTVVVEYTFN